MIWDKTEKKAEEKIIYVRKRVAVEKREEVQKEKDLY